MATIFCFSATGNSLYVAKRLAQGINAKVISMTSNVHTCSDDMIGFVFPTFYFGLPKVVDSFINQLKMDNPKAYIFTIATCGKFTCCLDDVVQRILTKKGLKLSYFAKVQCVENFTPTYKVNDRPSIHQITECKVLQITKELCQKKTTTIKPFGIINRVNYLRYPGNHSTPCDRKFSVKQCSSCGMCVNICPNKNIKLVVRKPEFQGNCQLCLACLHICPNEAINWKWLTKKHARYTNPNIKKSELINFMNQ